MPYLYPPLPAPHGLAPIHVAVYLYFVIKYTSHNYVQPIRALDLLPQQGVAEDAELVGTSS